MVVSTVCHEISAVNLIGWKPSSPCQVVEAKCFYFDPTRKLVSHADMTSSINLFQTHRNLPCCSKMSVVFAFSIFMAMKIVKAKATAIFMHHGCSMGLEKIYLSRHISIEHEFSCRIRLEAFCLNNLVGTGGFHPLMKFFAEISWHTVETTLSV